MPPRQPRIRMFAGPNGSGKSTVKDYLLPQHIGAYLNADEQNKPKANPFQMRMKDPNSNFMN